MIDHPFVSIIVPVYNAEKYLTQCIDSILIQTYTDFELLLINDGSIDASSEICDYYSKKDIRIKVYHKENGGVSTARNQGIENSTGKYICFIDSDDWIETTYLSTMLEEVESYNTDFLICGHFQHNEIINSIDKIYPIKLEGNGTCIFFNVMENRMSIPLWTCLIKKSILDTNKMVFTEQCKYGEDQEFINV